MLLIEEKYRSVAQSFLSSGTCPRCVLRFCCVAFPGPYRLPYQDLVCELQKCLNASNDNNSGFPPSKKLRLEVTNDCEHEGESEAVKNPQAEMRNDSQFTRTCNLCLGILQHLCDSQFVKKIFQKINSAGFEFKDFVFSMSLPAQLSVREDIHSALSRLGRRQDSTPNSNPIGQESYNREPLRAFLTINCTVIRQRSREKGEV
ncbi:tRNA pseudouridine synthase Pus10-like [Bombina bombina]|uniref:tRNA pseudouridine synthase Pus10-like n=1 Tax=Bombina bombina TaxID=8345 RepID=UPI00235AFFE7|nr:tRNA pseudouridine synthase Pus10-like [Bombina bombina]